MLYSTCIIKCLIEKVKHLRFIVITTCLKLSKLSNQQFRLSCKKHLTYHCLLDANLTKETAGRGTWFLEISVENTCCITTWLPIILMNSNFNLYFVLQVSKGNAESYNCQLLLMKQLASIYDLLRIRAYIVYTD